MNILFRNSQRQTENKLQISVMSWINIAGQSMRKCKKHSQSKSISQVNKGKRPLFSFSKYKKKSKANFVY